MWRRWSWPVREIVPPRDLSTLSTNIGVPSSFNMAFIPTDNVTSQDAELFITLRKEHRPTSTYMNTLRTELPRRFPGFSFYFQPADLVSQVLNFGIPAPIDIQVEGYDLVKGAADA